MGGKRTQPTNKGHLEEGTLHRFKKKKNGGKNVSSLQSFFFILRWLRFGYKICVFFVLFFVSFS